MFLYQDKLDIVEILTSITSSIQLKPYGSAHLR
jgi:hypothetical protein